MTKKITRMKKPINSIWLETIKVVSLLVLVMVAMNWGYLSKQVSAWLAYDVVNQQTSQESVIDGQPNRLAIPSLNLNVPLVYVNGTDEVTVQKGLESGVVHYLNTAMPGEYGNAYYFGHSSDYVFKKGKYKTVFAILPKIEVGAKIYITDAEGKQFLYLVKEGKVVEAKDVSVLSQGNRTKRLLTLQTSWPLGTALKRYVVVAEIE